MSPKQTTRSTLPRLPIGASLPNKSACRRMQLSRLPSGEKSGRSEKGRGHGLCHRFLQQQFTYINNPAYSDWYPGDHFKQMPIGDCWMLDLGGQYRARYQGEQNMRGLGLTGRDDNFLLHRTRLFANAKYSDWFRVYGEYIDADSNYENFPLRAHRGEPVGHAEPVR